MKILIITHYFPPLNSIASLRPYSWAKYWSRAGHDVTVLTTVKRNYHESRLNLDCSTFDIVSSDFKLFHQSKNNKDLKIENTINKNSKFYFLSFIESKLRKLSYDTGCFLWDCRIPNKFCLWTPNAIKKIKNSNKTFDFAISTFAPYVTFDIACQLKSMGIVKNIVLDYRDLWIDSHLFKGIFPFPIYEKKLERKYVSEAKVIVSVSKPLSNIIQIKYPNSHVETIENGFYKEDLENISPEPFWNDDRIRILYTGSIYPGKRDPSPLFEAIAELKKRKDCTMMLKKFEILFVGGKIGNIEDLASKYDIQEYVKCGGFLPREDALRMQRDANVLLFLEYEAPNVDGILTGKLFEYLASGTEVWGIGVTEKSSPGKLINEANAGILFGKDSGLIKKHLLRLLSSGKRPKSAVNEEVISRYDRKVLANKLLNLIQYRL